MSRTLYLHIGSHKTGTTSIQHFLVSRRDELAKRGYAYPVCDNGVNLGGGMAGRLDETPEHRKATSAGRLRQTVKIIREGEAQTVIGSSEGFSYMTDGEEITTLARKLGRSFDKIKIITYLRRQDQFAVSHHQEGANPQTKPAAKMHGHRPTALPETSPLQAQYLDYNSRIGHWADAFGDDNVIVRVYDRSLLKDGDSVSDFLELVGLGDMKLDQPVERNVSMGFVRTKIGHILNDVLPDQALRSAVLGRLPETGGKLLPSRAEAQAFLEPYLEGNLQLNKRLKISPVAGIFSEDFSMFPEEPRDQWTEDTADQAVRACVDMIKDLSSNRLVFATEDYAAAARALRDIKPELALRFVEAARSLRPGAKKLQAQAEALEKAVPKPAAPQPEPKPEPEPAKAETRGRGGRKGTRTKGDAPRAKARVRRKKATES